MKKKFNQVISISVSVDNIADQLLKSFNETFAHKEMLTETIIAIALKSETIGMIYNNLNGYTNEIDFHVGQHVVIAEDALKTYSYVQDENGEYKQERISVLSGEISEIDITRDQKVRIKYATIDRQGKPGTSQDWVSHLSLSLPEPVGAVSL